MLVYNCICKFDVLKPPLFLIKMVQKAHYDPPLAELIYTIAREIPLQLKRNLPDKFFKVIGSEKTAMKFAVNSSLDEKREFLSYLGIQNFLVFANTERIHGAHFVEILKKFQSGQQAATIKQIASLGLYVSADKEFVFLLGQISQSIQTKAYSMDMEVLRSGYHVKNWKGSLENKESSEAKSQNDSSIEIIRLLLSGNDVLEFSESSYGVPKTHLLVLLYLYIKKHLFVPHEAIKNKFVGTLTPSHIASAYRNLMEHSYVEKHRDWWKKEYSITAKGILMVNQFRDRVLSSFNF